MSPVMAGLFGVMTVVAFYAIFFAAHGVFKLLKKTSSYVYEKNTTKAPKLASKRVIDNQYYAIAEQEVNSGCVDAGLWSKALVDVNGNEGFRKVIYIKTRAKQLQEDAERQLEMEKRKQETIRIEEQEAIRREQEAIIELKNKHRIEEQAEQARKEAMQNEYKRRNAQRKELEEWYSKIKSDGK